VSAAGAGGTSKKELEYRSAGAMGGAVRGW
jgi:hypothetical protein